MFKNRKITVTVDKKNDDQAPTAPADPLAFEKRVEYITHKLGVLGAKVFAGVCIYVLLDTHRQVAVVKATHPPTD